MVFGNGVASPHPFPRPLSAPYRLQSGAVLLYCIAALVLLSALAAAVAALTPGAAMTTIAGYNEQRAYYLALSGLNFWQQGRTGVFNVNGDTFTLTESGPDASGYYTVSCLGRAFPNTPQETNIHLTARRAGLGPITFANDLGGFQLPVVGQTTNNRNAILIFASDRSAAPPGFTEAEWASLWSENVSRYDSGWMRLGGGVADAHGAVWYVGDHGVCPDGVCPDGACLDGKCAFANGLRAYFGFSFSGYDDSDDSGDLGDGFTFTVMTADNDPGFAAGGPASDFRSEYLGYAGPGPSGRGIAPPKMAVEVDVFPNKGSNPPERINSRRDNSNSNHMAVVFWGSTTTSNDDNVHGVGTRPRNPNAADSGGYYEVAKPDHGSNWLEDGQEHAMRLEIWRTGDAGQGVYTVLAWVDGAGAEFADVTRDYAAESPQLNYTARLDGSDHARLDRVYFGWTEGTGESTQTVAIHDFALDFRR